MKRKALPISQIRWVRLAGAGLLAFAMAGCAELRTLRDRAAVQEAEIQRLRQENEEYEKRYYETNEKRSEEIGGVEREMKQLQIDLERAKTVRSEKERALEDEIGKLKIAAKTREEADQSRISQLEKDKKELRASLKRAGDDQTELQARIVELESGQDKDHKRIEELNRQALERDESLKGLQKEKSALEESLKQTQKERDEAVGALRELKAQAEKSNQALGAAQEKIRELETAAGSEGSAEALAEAREEIKTLTRQIEEIKATAKDRETQLAQAAESPELGKKIEQLESQIRGLQANLDRKDPVLEEAAEKIKERLAPISEASRVTTILDRRGLRIILPSDQTFRKGTVILADAIKPVLSELADAITALPGRRIRIEGHTDNQPTVDLPYADNWGVGLARADQVRRYLTDEGRLGPNRLEVASRSFHDPLGDNRTAGGRAQNRRVEIVIGFPEN